MTPTSRVQFWTLWGPDAVCSKHRALKAAEREARRCEKRGGAYHRIVKVVEVRRHKVRP